MAERSQITSIMNKSVAEINQQLDPEQQISIDESAILFGQGAALDSLGLVNFIVLIEQNVEDELSVQLTIADEKAMSQTQSPFRSLAALTDYVLSLINEKS